MSINAKKALQAELYHALKGAWVQCSLDVPCNTGAEKFTLDVALHTDSFIFGWIDVSDLPTPGRTELIAKKYGMEQFHCSSMSDVKACVKWAKEIQERYVRSQVVMKVA